ncbi:hypothetical protein SMSP2_01847 [Limihaloglobus sulfuriphilus]|uniref:DUF3604 domain-containing protein n=1 Tax=Limihaloglobus sulfuriphilus TaxID=1851148 RepID=A0A1Q2MFJ4_9BACT|nr:hypothetical protein [Limihaloglobus sulfuriphilus]AQQ71473.1 hypothetical protein SMSP2_01847 [Limihaloglobus sulfuriphilus]
MNNTLNRRSFIKILTAGGSAALGYDLLLNQVFAGLEKDAMVLRFHAKAEHTGEPASIYLNFFQYDFHIQNGDVLEYDVFVPSFSSIRSGVVDFECEDGSILRDSKIPDQNDFSAHPMADTGNNAVDKWYHRSFRLDKFAGKKIKRFLAAMSCKDASAGRYCAFLRNIRLTRNDNVVINIVPRCDPDEFSVQLNRNMQNVSLDVIAEKHMDEPRRQNVTAAELVDCKPLSDQEKFAESPTLASSDDGRAWCLWLERKDDSRESIKYNEFKDGKWSQSKSLNFFDGKYETPRIACKGKHSPAVVWVEIKDEQWLLKAKVYNGSQFSAAKKICGGKVKNPVLQACSDGGFVAAWEQYSGGRFYIQLSKYKPEDNEWSPPVTVSDSQRNCYSPAVVEDGNGIVWAAYAKAENGEKNIYIISCDFSGKTAIVNNEKLVYRNSSRSYLNGNPALSCDGDNRIWAAWEQVSENKRDECIFENVECLCGCLIDGKLQKIASSGGHFSGNRPMSMANNRHPQIYLTDDNKMWLFSRQSYSDRRQWRISASVLTNDGWAQSVNVLGEIAAGRMDVTSVCKCDDEHVWVCWQSDNILSACYTTLLYEKLSTVNVSRLRLNKKDAARISSVKFRDFKKSNSTAKPCHYRGKIKPENRHRVSYNGKVYTLLMGNLHEHSDISRCWANCSDGSLDENYRFGIDVEGYDFVAITDHGYDMHEVNCRKTFRTAQFYTSEPFFIGLNGFEWTLTAGLPDKTVPGNGHRNIIFANEKEALKFVDNDVNNIYESRENPRSNRPDKLWELMRHKKVRAVTIPHHITDKHHPMDWDYHDEHYQSALEIYQCRGSSEYPGCPLETTNLTSLGDKSVRHALKRGYKFGFVASGDHNGMGDGLACVYVEGSDVSSEAIVEALLKRRCYATTGDKIILDFAVNDSFMGSEIITETSPVITGQFSAADQVKELVVFRNDKIVFHKAAGELKGLLNYKFEFEDREFSRKSYYYMRIIQQNGQVAWASPVWVNKG